MGKLEDFQSEMGLKGCKSSIFNAPGTEIPLPHPILKLGDFCFLTIGFSSKKWNKEKDLEQHELKGLQKV